MERVMASVEIVLVFSSLIQESSILEKTERVSDFKKRLDCMVELYAGFGSLDIYTYWLNFMICLRFWSNSNFFSMNYKYLSIIYYS